MNTKDEKIVWGMFMDSIDHMTVAAYQELQEAIKIRRVNKELLEHLLASIRWIIRYATKNNISLPNVDTIDEIMDKAIEIDEKTSDGYLQSD
jgi:hypothetical protein